MKALGLLLLCVFPTGAEVQLQSIQWQHAARGQAQGAKPAEITRLLLAPGDTLQGRLRASVKMLNRGPAMAGILLRYVVSAKLAREGRPEEAAWALPFLSEEKRVPKIGANQYFETTIDPTALTELYLKKVNREGYWPLELKIQVMLGPRRDAKGPLQIIDSSLPVGPS